MAIKLLTLNIEGSKHLDKVVPFFKQENADIVCLQEVFKVDFPKIKKELNMQGKLFPGTNIIKPNKFADQLHGLKGVAYLTRLKHSSIEPYYYMGDNKIKEFVDPYLVNRILVYSVLDINKQKYIVGTTHFPWTPDGKSSKQQWQAFNSLMAFIKKFDGFILCGDFNAPRGGDIFSAFTEYFTDSLPQNITSTLDPALHRKGDRLQLVVDTIFHTSNYEVNQVRVVEGVSDHKAIIGEISTALKKS